MIKNIFDLFVENEKKKKKFYILGAKFIVLTLL